MTENEFDGIIDFLKGRSKIDNFIEVVDDLVVFFESDCDDKIDGQSYLEYKDYGIGILPNKHYGFFRINIKKDRSFEIFKIRLNNFLANCESSKGAYVYYNLKFQSLKDLNDQLFINALNQLDIRCKEEQISARIFDDFSSDHKQNKFEYGPETPIVGELLSDALRDGLKISARYFSLIFSKKIDISSIIYYQDPIEEIPKNLIDDFDQFTKKMKMSNKDKSDLITIFKKWKSNI